MQKSLPIGAMEINFLLYLMETTIKIKFTINMILFYYTRSHRIMLLHVLIRTFIKNAVILFIMKLHILHIY